MNEVLRSGWLTTGPVAESFEREFAEFLPARFAVAVNSATAGLHLGLEALEIKPDDLIVTSPFSFTASAEVARYLNAHPLFVDIEKNSFNIDPDHVEKALKNKGRKIRCILPIHVAGHPCRMKILRDISDMYETPILEDAAHAFPCRTPIGPVGTIGKVGVFSFYATKSITTGEGGMLVTGDPEIAKRATILRLHGIDRTIWDRYRAEKPVAWEYDVVAAGYKYNITDVAAAIGREQLKKADSFMRRRTEIAHFFLDRMKEYDFLRMPPSSPDHCWHLFIVRLDLSKMAVTRNRIIELLMEKGIGVSVHFKPLHTMSYYKEMYGFKPGDFPLSLKAYNEAISLPIYPSLTDLEMHRIVDTFIQITLKHYKAG